MSLDDGQGGCSKCHRHQGPASFQLQTAGEQHSSSARLLALQAIQRALDQDLNKEQRYQAAFRRNKGGKVIIDRAFNTAKLISMYNPDAISGDRISWNPEDPNLLKIFLPGMLQPLASWFQRCTCRRELPSNKRFDYCCMPAAL